MVLNEPETSLHPDLVPALASLIVSQAKHSQVWVVSHSDALTSLLETEGGSLIRLEKELGETHMKGQGLLNSPVWNWPSR